MFDQRYKLFEVDSFLIPVESSQQQATIIMDFIDLLAVNEIRNSYFSVSHYFLKEHCMGKNIVTCNELFTTHDLTTSPSCGSAIYQNDIEKINKLCKIGFVEINESTRPKIYDLKNSSVLLVNPARQNLYSRCSEQERKQFITDGALVTIELKCFCYIFNNYISTPVFAGHRCLEQTLTRVSNNDHVNILFLTNLLNKTVSETRKHLQQILKGELPQIHLPNDLDGIKLSKESRAPIYDLKNIMASQHNNYMNTLYGRVSQHTKILDNFQYFRYIGYGVGTTVVILVILGICLTCKVKGLGHSLALGKMIAAVETAPLRLNSDTLPLSPWQVSIEIISVLIVLLAFVFWIYKHVAVIKKIAKYCAFPISEFNLENKQ